jgi:site-specific DNA-cytosine methylase
VGVEPVFINSALLSAQNRQRWYWTNIPGIEQPEDKKIVLRDILEHGYDSERDKSHCLDANYYKGSSVENYFKKSRRQMVYQDDTSNLPEKSSVIKSNYYKSSKANFENDKSKGGKFSATGIPQTTHDTPKQVGVAADINGHDILKRVYSEDGKSPTLNTCSGGNREPKVIAGAWRGRYYKDGVRQDQFGSVAGETTQMLELRKDEKTNTLTTVQKDNVIVGAEKDKVYWRKLTPRECESLQTVPTDYTAHVSNSRRYQCLGNGWTVDVICHILKNMQIIEEGGTVAPTKGQETFDF